MEERDEFFPFALYDLPEEAVIHDPHASDVRYYHEKLLEEKAARNIREAEWSLGMDRSCVRYEATASTLQCPLANAAAGHQSSQTASRSSARRSGAQVTV